MKKETIAQINSAEDLKETLLSVLSTNGLLATKAAQIISQLQTDALSWQEKYQALLGQFKLAQQKRFASSSEKCPGQLGLFDEADNVPAEVETNTIVVAEHKRQAQRPKRTVLPEHFPREVIEHDVAEADKVCGCGCQKTRFGEEITEQLDVMPPKFKVVQHVRPKYVCKTCQGNISIAPMPKLFLPKSIAAPSLVAFTATSKYIDHLPLYRQEAMWERYGIKLPRNTTCGWLMKAHEKMLPLLPLLKADIIASGYIQADETPVQVMRELGRRNQQKSYMWIYRGNAPNHTAVYYEYQETRAAEHPKKFLAGFQGYLQTDGYGGYDWVDKMQSTIHLGCMAHARRPFAKLIKLAKGKGQAAVALKWIAQLYAAEEEARENNMSVEQRFELRRNKSVPVLLQLKNWLEKIKLSTSPQGILGKGIEYMLEHWDVLNHYLLDGRLEIDNNWVENDIRPFAVGKKNWLFKGSPLGAKAGACFYSLIATCKANDIDPFKYLNYLFTQLPFCKIENDYRQLLPYNIDLNLLK